MSKSQKVKYTGDSEESISLKQAKPERLTLTLDCRYEYYSLPSYQYRSWTVSVVKPNPVKLITH